MIIIITVVLVVVGVVRTGIMINPFGRKATAVEVELIVAIVIVVYYIDKIVDDEGLVSLNVCFCVKNLEKQT